MAVVHPPLFLQSEKHPARATRALIAEMYDEGVMSLLDLVVTERASGGANYSVDVSIGRCVIEGDNIAYQGNYMVTNDATVNLVPTSLPSPGNSRVDLVCVRVLDDAEDSSTQNEADIYIKAGTPTTGTPSAPSLGDNEIDLASFVVTSATTTITNAAITDRRTLAGRRCTPGTMESDASTHLPSGWLWCDGSAVSRTTYARLFAHIGTSWGAGDGATTFNLPDYRGRVMVGSDALGGADAHRLDGVSGTSRFTGGTGGEALHVLTASEMPSHTHTGPSHFHTMNHDHPQTNVLASGQDVGYGAAVLGPSSGAYRGILLGSGTNLLSVDVPNYTGNTGNAGTGATGSAGSGNAHNNMQPWAICAMRIRT